MTYSRGETRTHQEFCLFLSLPLPQVVFALNQTLLQQESLRAGSLQIPYTTEDLIKHYNCGDLSSIIFNHDASQVSLATAALVLCICSHSANPCLTLISPQLGRLQARAKAMLLVPCTSAFLRLLSQGSASLHTHTHTPPCCTQAVKARLAFPFGQVPCLL